VRGLAVLALACLQGEAVRFEPTPAEVLWAERADRFLRAWEGADADHRRAAEEALAAQASPGRPLDRRPSLEALAVAQRVLAGAELEGVRVDALARLADAVDLTVVPGCFASRSASALGASVTAEVRARFPARLAGTLTLRLIWVGPDGHEQRARSEPFDGAAFELGFPVFLRAPRASPGPWWLVPELELDGRSVRGAPVPVWALDAEESELDRRPEADTAWLELVRHGRRSFGPRRGGDSSGAGDPSDPRFAPLASYRPGASARGRLVFLAPEGEAPGFVLGGFLGERWRALADRLGLELVVLDPRAKPDELGRVLGLASDVPVVLVARGDAAVQLHGRAAKEALALQGIVLCGSLVEPGPALPRVPVLLVCNRGVAPGPSTPAATVTRREGAREAFLSEPLLPDLLEPWWNDTFGAGR